MRLWIAALVVASCAAPSSSPAPPDLAVAADLATAAPPDLPAALCGNGACEAGEDGASCGADCCDAATSCDATRGNAGAEFCRSMNGGPFAWITQAGASALCSNASDIGKTTWACAARAGTCCSVPGGYVDGACP